ncbi:hypothetical protein EFA69_06570 [Rufibacter immobilis]|uniref:Uncharacterized protein n=1 Tax=Rufibacter immobilis TaxID=1348778 RepID=A0A3M9MZG9_9BACT|nr:hypothetical protein [Rufibacter immobilis]RNI30951.1 hypothetical protein EFA69_06570 [Rufibacter immobilis]
MIYDKPLYNSFRNQIGYNITGCKRLFLTESKNVRWYGFENRQINHLDMSGSFAMFENLSNVTYSVKAEQSKNGVSYKVDITFSIGGIKADASYMLENLINSELTGVVEDRNGRYWLVGFRQGLVSDYESKTEDSSYSVKMTTTQLTKPEEIAPATMAAQIFAPFDDLVTPSPVFTVPSRDSQGGTTLVNKNFTVKTVTVENYQILPSDEFLLLPFANSVFLPATAPQGKQYVIKCDYDASVEPSFIKVNSGDIDYYNLIEMYTMNASFTVVYDGAGSWHIVSFSH